MLRSISLLALILALGGCATTGSSKPAIVLEDHVPRTITPLPQSQDGEIDICEPITPQYQLIQTKQYKSGKFKPLLNNGKLGCDLLLVPDAPDAVVRVLNETGEIEFTKYKISYLDGRGTVTFYPDMLPGGETNHKKSLKVTTWDIACRPKLNSHYIRCFLHQNGITVSISHGWGRYVLDTLEHRQPETLFTVQSTTAYVGTDVHDAAIAWELSNNLLNSIYVPGESAVYTYTTADGKVVNGVIRGEALKEAFILLEQVWRVTGTPEELEWSADW